jgi:hypothetical protein
MRNSIDVLLFIDELKKVNLSNESLLWDFFLGYLGKLSSDEHCSCSYENTIAYLQNHHSSPERRTHLGTTSNYVQSRHMAMQSFAYVPSLLYSVFPSGFFTLNASPILILQFGQVRVGNNDDHSSPRQVSFPEDQVRRAYIWEG